MLCSGQQYISNIVAATILRQILSSVIKSFQWKINIFLCAEIILSGPYPLRSEWVHSTFLADCWKFIASWTWRRVSENIPVFRTDQWTLLWSDPLVRRHFPKLVPTVLLSDSGLKKAQSWYQQRVTSYLGLSFITDSDSDSHTLQHKRLNTKDKLGTLFPFKHPAST